MADALMDAWKKAEASGDYSGFSYGLRDSGLTPAALQQQYGLSARDLAYMQSRPGMSGFGAAAPAAPAPTPAAGIASLSAPSGPAYAGISGMYAPSSIGQTGGSFTLPNGQLAFPVYGNGGYDASAGDYVAGPVTEFRVYNNLGPGDSTRYANTPYTRVDPAGNVIGTGTFASDLGKDSWVDKIGQIGLATGAALVTGNALGLIAAPGGSAAAAGTAPVGNASGFIGEGVASGVPAWDAAASGAAGAGAGAAAGTGALASAVAPTLLDKALDKVTDVVSKGTGNSVLDKVIDKVTTPSGLASLAALIAGMSSGSGGGGGGGYAGYEGGIPELTATRTQYANDPTRRPGGAPQRYFSDTTYTPGLGGPGLVQASDPTAGAWQAGNVPEVNRLLGINKPTLQKLIEAYNLSPADIEFLKTRGVNLPAGGATTGATAGVASLPRTLTEEQSRAPVGDELAQAWRNGDIDRVNVLLNTKKSRQELDQVIKDYNLSPADIAHLRGQGVRLAAGGITSLGAYSDGGRMVKGPGDGVSDGVPAVIGGGQPAALATDEFVLPARVVAELGNGSSEAGAKKLYAMMDRVEAAARKAKRGQDSKAERFLPA